MHLDDLRTELDGLEAQGLLKREWPLAGPQGATVALDDGRQLINFCANNYLGLASHPDVIRAAHDALDEWGYGMASVRFICGTQTIHRRLEETISGFLGTEDTILYGSCFDANAGLFETILDEGDAVVSDELNHASIIDGIRLCRARRLRYPNRDVAALREVLRQARADGARRILVATDGVFSMDGCIAPLDEICAVADEFGALVMVDDSHAVGVVGPTGRGTPERFGVTERVDIVTGTLGKALGGASGGYTSGRAEIVAMLRQRSRPYLFSNSVAPGVVAGSLKALDLVTASSEARDTLAANSALFRSLMTEAGFTLLPGTHPITPVMFPGEDGARLATEISDHLLGQGVYVIAFSFPVVPRGQARIRVQLSAAHSEADVRRCAAAFVAAREAVG